MFSRRGGLETALDYIYIYIYDATIKIVGMVNAVRMHDLIDSNMLNDPDGPKVCLVIGKMNRTRPI